MIRYTIKEKSNIRRNEDHALKLLRFVHPQRAGGVMRQMAGSMQCFANYDLHAHIRSLDPP